MTALRCAATELLAAAHPPQEPYGRIVELLVEGTRLRFRWGQIHELGTPAYWAEQTRRRKTPASYRLGATFEEEVAACLLGGYGVPAHVGLAAYLRVRDAGCLRSTPTAHELERLLRQPLGVGERRFRYRFPRQRAQRLAAALLALHGQHPPDDPLDLRDWLLELPGIGPKTASWIARNLTASNKVAIVDVHVHRAGLAAGFFSPDWRLPRHYRLFESAFCAVAQWAGVGAAALDACIWDQMQGLGPAKSLLLPKPHFA